MARSDEKNSQYKGVECHKCEGYGHIRTECATYLKKQKKRLTVSWYDDDESEGDGERDSSKHVAAMTGRISSDNNSCDENFAYNELVVTYRNLNNKNTDICKQLEEQKGITYQLEE